MGMLQWNLARRAAAGRHVRALATRAAAGAFESDTIFALSTAEGKAGVAVIRVSGDQAQTCLTALTKQQRLPPPRRAAYRRLYHPKSDETLDEALALYFPQPNSFTGEDVVEFHVHGSVAVVSGVLEALSHIPHCRAAEAGEYTERAFENNKIDLMQVEGLADLLSAETEAQRAQALRQLAGDIGGVYETWRDELVRCLAHTEAMIDFGDDEDDVTDSAYVAAVNRVKILAESIRSHLADGRRGEILRSGVQVAIVGPPNAGKSSLLNILARRPAAIVSAIAGTTRDIVQVPLNIAGFPVLVSDTAGLRETQDLVEREGVLRAQQCAADADIRVVMMDVQDADELFTDEYVEYLSHDNTLLVLNKVDQAHEREASVELLVAALERRDLRCRVLVISCVQNHGIDALIDVLAAAVKQRLQSASSTAASGAIITRERHRQHLTECLRWLDQFLLDPEQSEIAAEDLRRAVTSIGRILGRVDVEDVLDILFADFCIVTTSHFGGSDMEFVPVEVYAPVDEYRASGSTTQPTSDDVRSQRHPGSRIPQVLEADSLPPITDAGAAFESFQVAPDRGVFGGRHDGTILHWKIQPTTSVTPFSFAQLRGHSGAVLALDFCAALGKDGLLFSGSADRSIKIWDPWRGTEGEQQLHGNRVDHFCVQTLPAHQASVTSVKLLTQQQRHGLVSCSLDHTVKIWAPAHGRGLLLYPWFVLAQTITLATTTCWPTSLCIRDTATSCSLFVGDSSGTVAHYTNGLFVGEEDEDCPPANGVQQTGAIGSSTSKPPFKLKRKHTQFHALGVVHLQLIRDDNFVASLGFDHKAHILDATSGSVSVTIANRNATRFTSCAWDAKGGQWLFLADAMGFVHVWNVFYDRWVAKEKLVPRGTALLSISLHPTTDWLFVGAANAMKQWKINRDVGYSECSGHADAIVGFAVLKDDVLMDLHQHQHHSSDGPTVSSRFFSVSLDNTLRCWDAYDLKAAFGFEERQSEITCVATATKFAKIVTGHESGLLKAWSVHTGHFVSAPLPSKSAVTCLKTGMVRDQELIFASDIDGNLFLYELNLDSMSFTMAAPIALSLSSDPTRRDEISAILFCNGDYLRLNGGSEFLVVGTQTGWLAIWNLSKKLVSKAWKAHDDAISSIARHGCFVCTGSDDTTVKVWNCLNLTEPYELAVLRSAGVSCSSGSGSAIVAVDVVQESGVVLCAAADGTLTAWNYTDYDDKECTDYGAYGKLLYRTQHSYHLRCMQYWPSRRAVLCGTSEGRVLVLSLPALGHES